METNTNLRISIPKPCHEDWNKFTPDEKGAFCKVCSKSVHDFTKKSTEEIQTILVEEISAGKKVCGRFREDQIEPTPEIIPSLSPYELNFKRAKKFMIALFLVFGGYLFNSVKSSAQRMGKVAYTYKEPVRGEVQVKEPVKGKVDYNHTDTLSSKTTVSPPTTVTPPLKASTCTNSNMPIGDVAIEPVEKLTVVGLASIIEPIVKGNVAMVKTPEVPTKDSVATIEANIDSQVPLVIVDTSATKEEGQQIDKEFSAPESTYVEMHDVDEMVEEQTKTRVLIDGTELDSNNAVITNVLDSVIAAEPAEIIEQQIVMGGIIAMPDDWEERVFKDLNPVDCIEKTGEVVVVPESSPMEFQKDSSDVKNNIFTGVESLENTSLSIESYPNPSTGFIIIKYTLKKNLSASIRLYNINGDFVKTLLEPQNLYAADYQTSFDISDQPNGIYFCELISGENKSTARIVISK